MNNLTAKKVTAEINRLSNIWMTAKEDSEAYKALEEFNTLCKKYKQAKPFKAWFCIDARGSKIK